MRKTILFLFSALLAVLFLFLPQRIEAFSYRGESLGIYFDGERLFDKAVLSSHQKNCASLAVENFSDKEQELGLIAEGFEGDEFFQHVVFSVEKDGREMLKKAAQEVSADTNEPESLFSLESHAKQDFNICLQIAADLPNEWQGRVSQPVNFLFGFVGQDFSPPVSLASTEGSASSATGETEGVSTQQKTGSDEIEKVKGVEKEEAGKCRFFDCWCCWLLLLVVVALIGWLIYKKLKKD